MAVGLFLVDDEPDWLVEILEAVEESYEVVSTATRHDEAVRKIPDLPQGPVIAIIDGLGGYGKEVAAALREQRPQQTGIICFSGHDAQEWGDENVSKEYPWANNLRAAIERVAANMREGA